MIGKFLLPITAALFILPSAKAASDTSACRSAVTMAERQAGIPPRLLDAISRVESGRRDPAGAGTLAWPWTVNAAGKGYFYDSRDEAIAAVRDFQAHGITSIDVGCMQINLLHHPDAFTNLEDAFDPMTNARYGARFLSELHLKLGAWLAATAAYHSLTPALGADYERHVFAVWSGQPDSYRPPDFLPQVIMTTSGPRAFLPASHTLATFPTWHSGDGASGDSNILRPPTVRSGSVHMVSYAPPPRIIRHPILASSGSQGGGIPTGRIGRDLASYRSAPVRLAWRMH